jgi:chaperonin GroES
MSVNVEKLTRVFGERVLVKRLAPPEKRRGLYVPEAYIKQRKEGGRCWWAAVVAFGLDSRAEEEHGISAGDVVGIEPIGNHYAGFVGTDGSEYAWVPDEHLALADSGTAAAWVAGQLDEGSAPKFRPLGARVLLKPDVLEERSKAGLIIPGVEQKRAHTGTVVFAGPGPISSDGTPLDWEQPEVESKVLYVSDSESAARIDLLRQEYVVLRAEDLIAEVEAKEVAHVH